MPALSCLGIDPGASPGYAWRSVGGELRVATRPPLGPFSIIAVEGQFQAPRGRASRGGEVLSIHHQAPLTLALTAGMQLQAIDAEIKLVMAPPVWRGLLWADGGGRYGLAMVATRNRLLQLEPRLVSATDDEIMAFGIMLAAEAVGNAKAGAMKDGTPWKLVKQPGRFEVKVSTPKAKARAFAKALAR